MKKNIINKLDCFADTRNDYICHAEFISASQTTPLIRHFVSPSPTIGEKEIICAKHDKNLSTYRLNVLETDNTPTLSRICKFAFSSLTNSTLSQRERVKYGFTLSEVFSPCRKVKLSFGFTLAEVLITLGIIGVVAALTIAPLVQKYRIKQLEVAFKRSSSLILQALNNTAIEFGYSSFNDFNQMCKGEGQYNKSCSTWRSENSDLMTNIQNTFIANFNNPNPIKQSQRNKLSQIKVKCFGGNICTDYKQLYGITDYNTPNNNLYFLNDGSVVSGLTFYYHQYTDGISFTFDTNGPYKGPNRYGYDLFLFTTGSWNPMCTNNTSGLNFNGRGCYKYALKNQNPDDDTKGYWESLKL